MNAAEQIDAAYLAMSRARRAMGEASPADKAAVKAAYAAAAARVTALLSGVAS